MESLSSSDFEADEMSDSSLEISTPGSSVHAESEPVAVETAKKLYDSDSSGDEGQRGHSNRRLESEKTPITILPSPAVVDNSSRPTSRRLKVNRNVRPRRRVVIVSIPSAKSSEMTCELRGGNTDRKSVIVGSDENYCSARDHESMEPPQALNKRERDDDEDRPRASSAMREVKEEGRRTIYVSPPKASAMWEDILRTRSLWKTEPLRKRRRVAHESSLSDYEAELAEFMTCDLEHRRRHRGESLYRRRLREKMDHPDSRHLLREFVISPARLEVLFASLSDEESAIHRLDEVCRLLEWPPARYSSTPCGRPGYVSSTCTIKTVTLDPQQPASNTLLADELAASHALSWLAVVPHDPRQDLFNQTYF